ncbi:MAG: SIMPL domain-containing protein [Bdellovibrionota bacterium]
MVQNLISKKLKPLFLLTCFAAYSLNAAGTVSVEAEGSAEANPDLYVYSMQVSANCFDSDEAVEEKVAELEDLLSESITPFLSEGVEVESQYYTTSNNLPEQNQVPVSTYIRNSGDYKVVCSAGKWNYSSSIVFKLLDVTQRKALQKVLTQLTAKNGQQNADLDLDKKTWGISAGYAQPSLKAETKKVLFEAAYKDASKNAQEKLRTILTTEKIATGGYTLTEVVENPAEGQSRNYRLESLAMAAPAPESASPGVQKLKLTVNYRFKYTANFASANVND